MAREERESTKVRCGYQKSMGDDWFDNFSADDVWALLDTLGKMEAKLEHIEARAGALERAVRGYCFACIYAEQYAQTCKNMSSELAYGTRTQCPRWEFCEARFREDAKEKEGFL